MTIEKIATSASLEGFVGSARALIEAGLVVRRQLPGAAGMPKRSATFYRGAKVAPGSRKPQDEHYLRIRRLSGDRYLVTRGLGAEEREARQARVDALFQLARAQQEAAEAMKIVPTSSVTYRERCLSELRRHLAFFRETRLDCSESRAGRCGGFKFDAATLEAFDEAVSELLAVLRNGHVCFDDSQHRAVVAAIRTRVAKADASLQELLAGAIASAAIRAAEAGPGR